MVTIGVTGHLILTNTDKIDLFQHRGPPDIKARDLLHVAVMHNECVTKIISTDRHSDHITGIERLDPLDLWAQAQSVPR